MNGNQVKNILEDYEKQPLFLILLVATKHLFIIGINLKT